MCVLLRNVRILVIAVSQIQKRIERNCGRSDQTRCCQTVYTYCLVWISNLVLSSMELVGFRCSTIDFYQTSLLTSVFFEFVISVWNPKDHVLPA
uniref:Uncharacterized protein n=1 Tax=Rhizophora mucronata TaxID=61149 RepID=A0A2P2J178_RHIMU